MVSKTYITFGDNGQGHVLSEGEIKVSDKVTLRHFTLVQSVGDSPEGPPKNRGNAA
jgi:hypothetical protein